MKVLIINAVCGVGSTGRITSDMHDALIENGHECKIAFGLGAVHRVPASDTFKFNNWIGYYTHNAVSRITDRAGFYSPIATMRLIRMIREYDPDLIQLHNLHGYYLNVHMLFDFLAAFDRPVVWTLHDCWPVTGHCAYFTMANCDRWKTGCHHCVQTGSYPASYVFDRSRKNWEQKKDLFTSVKSMTIVTPSQWLADIVSESYLSAYPVQVIHNGIDLQTFKPSLSGFREKNGLQEKVIILGVAIVWDYRKGLGDFVKLSKLLNDHYKIVLVGLNGEQLASLPENILGISRTDSVAELAQIYTTADVFVNTTYEDNFPTVNIEALACGTPVITYKTGGSPEAVDKTCGAVVETGNISALYDAICSPELSSYDRPAIAEYAGAFSKEQKYREYSNLYEELLSERRR